jgi:hypothetical protein
MTAARKTRALFRQHSGFSRNKRAFSPTWRLRREYDR